MLDATPLLRIYARHRLSQLSRQHPHEVQSRQLLALTRHARETRFGQAHSFDEIRSVEDFQARVPLRRYEDFWAEYWQAAFPVLKGLTWPDQIANLAVTSGTSTGRVKYIPISHQMARSNNRAAVDLLVHHVADRPQSRVMAGKNFVLGGTTALEDHGSGVVSGDLSGIARLEVPPLLASFVFPDPELARETDWAHKAEAMARASLSEPIRSIASIPSWMLLFFEELAKITGKRRLVEIYPDLELVSHGGVDFGPYREAFAEWMEGSHAELREVYPASEGFIALSDEAPEDGLRLFLDNGLFFEFVPVEELGRPDPTRHWIGNAEIGRNYALVLSNNAGLWAYILGDTVRLVSLDPPRIKVTGRISEYLSAFGEHLTPEEIAKALLGAAANAGLQISDYSVGPVFPSRGKASRGRHVYVIEFRGRQPSETELESFAAEFDYTLILNNDDYDSHRQGGFGMDAPEVIAVAPGTFAEWMRRRGRLGGQNKVPRIINDPEILTSLVGLARESKVAHRR
ncbi:GH3 auxin-responsive promoter family protein [Afifella sp. YEN Y35]|uniref:GH3 family domain-containing protein n=1 Tax=Afifella sp. YEN Y35 TaxID=3388337 RepID=UPI0039E06B17